MTTAVIIGAIATSIVGVVAIRENNRVREVSSKSASDALKREAVTEAVARRAGDVDNARAVLPFLEHLSKSDYNYLNHLIEGLIALNDADYEEALKRADSVSSQSLGREKSQQIAALCLRSRQLAFREFCGLFATM